MKILGKKSLSSLMKVLTDIIILFFLFLFVFYLLSYITNFKSKKINSFGNIKIVIGAPHIEYPVIINMKDIKSIISNQKSFTPTEDNTKQFKKSEKKTRLYLFIIGILSLILVLIILFQLRKIFVNLEKKQPFSKDNPKRFLIIGIIIFFIGILKNIGLIISNEILIKYLIIHRLFIERKFNFDFSILLLGLLFIILSEVFRQGVMLKEENDLTI